MRHCPQIVKKLNLREAQIVDFLDYVEAHGGYGNQEDAGFSVDERQGPEGGIPSRASHELDAYLRQCASMLREARKPQRLPNGSRATSLPWTEELADEFLAFARKGYVSTMAEFLENVGDGCLPGSCLYGTAQGETRNAPNVDALRARRALWEACVSRLDVPLLHFLQQRGLDLASATMVQEGAWRTCTLIDDVACAYDNGRAHSSAQARVFVIAVLDAGVCLRGNGSREIMQVFSMFPQDEDLFALLADAGFSFHVPDGHGGRGSADASVVRYLMSPFCASVTAARNRARTFEHKAQDWADVAYMLCHGATLYLDCHHAEEVRREFRQHPAEFAALAKTVPPQAMVPMATVMGLLLPSGESVVLEVLAGWKDAFDADILTTTVDVCSRLGMTEATAYLLDMRDAIFGEDSGLSLEL